MTEESDGSTRRGLLRAGAATLASVASMGTAGCFATLPPLGGRVDYGSVDAPSAGDPTYRKWLPKTSAFADGGDFATYRSPSPEIVRPASFFRHHDGPYFHRHLVEGMQSETDYFGIGWENFDAVIDYFGLVPYPTYALLGSVDPESVGETLTASGYERTDVHEGFAVYERSDVRRAVGVSDAAIVWASGDLARDHLETVVGTRRGAVERRHESDEAFRKLSSAAGASPYQRFAGPEDQVTTGDLPAVEYSARSYRFDVNFTEVYLVDHLLYPPGETPSKDEIMRRYRHERASRTSVSVEVSVDGRMATVEMRQPKAGFESDRPTIETDTVAWPQVTWGLDHDRDAGTVTVRHEAGQPVDATNLSLRIPQRTLSKEEPLDTQFVDRYDAVTVGDAITVEVDDVTVEDAHLSLWYFVEGVQVTTMFNYDLFRE